MVGAHTHIFAKDANVWGTGLKAHPRAVYVLYHTPLRERVFGESAVFVRVGGTEQCSIYSAEKAVYSYGII